MSNEDLENEFKLIPEENDEGYGEPEYSAIELKARRSGHISKEEWVASGRAEDEWIDPVRYNERGEFMGVIHNQNKKLKTFEKALKDMKDLYDNASKIAEERVKTQLLAEKAEALEQQDFQRVVEVDEQIREHTNKIDNTSVDLDEDEEDLDDPRGFKSYVDDWENDPKNSWFHEDEDARETAELVAVRTAQKFPDASPEQIFAHVDKQVRKLHPNIFVNQKKLKGQDVASPTGGRGTKQGGTVSVSKLSDVEREVGSRLVATGTFENLEEYAKSLASNGMLSK